MRPEGIASVLQGRGEGENERDPGTKRKRGWGTQGQLLSEFIR